MNQYKETKMVLSPSENIATILSWTADSNDMWISRDTKIALLAKIEWSRLKDQTACMAGEFFTLTRIDTITY